MIYIRLFIEFFITGLFAVGGGLATIPFLEDMGERTSWFSFEELINMIAISESTPGPIGINMATYVGYETAGVFGAVVSVLGIITPAFFVIIMIYKMLEKFKNSKYIKKLFKILTPISLALISLSFIEISKSTFINDGNFNLFYFFIAILLLGFSTNKKTKNTHPAFIIIISAIMGIVLHL